MLFYHSNRQIINPDDKLTVTCGLVEIHISLRSKESKLGANLVTSNRVQQWHLIRFFSLRKYA